MGCPGSVLNVGLVYAGDANPPILQAKLFRIVATAPLPPEAERLATVYGQEMEEGFEAFYFVQGSHLVDIDENSLSIESIRTSAGANIAEKRNDSDVPQIRLHWAATDWQVLHFFGEGGRPQSVQRRRRAPPSRVLSPPCLPQNARHRRLS